MAPAIATSDTPNGGDVAQPSPALHQPMSEMEYALAQMRAVIEQHSDYVGLNFAAEARAMHLGDLPSRPIFGEAKIEDAKALLDDGIPVAPLPFLPRPKVN